MTTLRSSEDETSVTVSELALETEYAFQLILYNGQHPPLSSISNVATGRIRMDKGLGKAWTEASESADFSGRYNHAAVAFNDKLWVIGGWDDTKYTNDVWSSPDGKIWTEETENVASETRFSPRYAHAAVAFDNKLWVIGGCDVGKSYQNDVWSSPDGRIWTEETENVASETRFSPRYAHAAVAFDNKLWVIGGGWVVDDGLDDTTTNDVWSSPDGKTWTEVIKKSTTSKFSPRSRHKAVEFNNKLWVIGGYNADKSYQNDVWSSSDGESWTEVTAEVHTTRFGTRYYHAVAALDDKLWVIGGGDVTSKNDVWSSFDGKSWIEETEGIVSDTKFSPRLGHTAVVFDNKLWIIGGRSLIGSTYANDVWYSP